MDGERILRAVPPATVDLTHTAQCRRPVTGVELQRGSNRITAQSAAEVMERFHEQVVDGTGLVGVVAPELVGGAALAQKDVEVTVVVVVGERGTFPVAGAAGETCWRRS